MTQTMINWLNGNYKGQLPTHLNFKTFPKFNTSLAGEIVKYYGQQLNRVEYEWEGNPNSPFKQDRGGFYSELTILYKNNIWTVLMLNGEFVSVSVKKTDK